MTISVLMSVYKSEQPAFMGRALQSVWTDQTLKPDQIVLIEDGPLGDGLLEVITAWKERLGERMVIHRNEVNLGLTKSLNIGLRYVTSDLIARMDSDDISDPRRFERQAAFLEGHPDIDIVGGSLQEFDEENPCLNVRHYPRTNEEAMKYIMKASPLAHPTVMMRRKLFDSGLRYDERFRTNQDLALWFDALATGHKIANLQEVTIYFRRDASLYKRRNRSRAIGEFKIYMRGIYRMKGAFTLAYLYPLARLAFRLMPTTVVRWIYGSRIRNGVLQ